MQDRPPRFAQEILGKTGPKEDGVTQPVKERGPADQAPYLTLKYKDGRRAQFLPWMTCSIGEWTAAEGGRPERMELFFGTVMGPVLLTVTGFYLGVLVAEITEGKRKLIEEHDERMAALLRRENADAELGKKQPIVLSVEMEPSIDLMRAALKEMIRELGKPAEGTGKSRGR